MADKDKDENDPKKKKKSTAARKPDAGNKVEESSDKKKKPVLKSLDDEKRLITGVVLQPNITDAHGDVISELDIEQTAFDFMELHQTIGKQHSEKADAVPVESFIAREDMTIGGEPVVKGTWVMTVKVLDDKLWEDAKDGKFTGFSIGGVAETEDL